MSQTRQFRIRGRVQGVGFRFFVRQAAQELGVFGWVRNCSDGSVEGAAQGSAEVLEEFARRLRAGPLWSEVTELELAEQAAETFSGFEIRF